MPKKNLGAIVAIKVSIYSSSLVISITFDVILASITKFVLEKLRSIRDKNQENNVDEDSKVGASNEVKGKYGN